MREKEGGLYHNRADDGFLYFPCGSYCAGPVEISGNHAKLVASLTFPSYRRLVTLKCEKSAGITLI